MTGIIHGPTHPEMGPIEDPEAVVASTDAAADAPADAVEPYTPQCFFFQRDSEAWAAIGRGEATFGLGDEGRAISSLKFVLDRLGCFEEGGALEHGFGRETERAVCTFQRARGLTPTGRVDRETLIELDKAFEEGWNPIDGAAPHWALSSLLSGEGLEGVRSGKAELDIGQSGASVLAMQDALAVLAYLPPGSASGTFDDATAAALVAFQTSAGLTPHGRFDRATLEALDAQLVAAGRADPASLPAPAPLAAAPESFLATDAERAAYEFIELKLWTGTDLYLGVERLDAVVTDEETIAILDRLESLDPQAFDNVLRALAATPNASAAAPTLLDKLIVCGTSDLGGGVLSSRFVDLLERKLGPLEQSPEAHIFRSISPESVDQLRAKAANRQLIENLFG